MKWVSAQTRRRWGGERFYDHSFTSREKEMDSLVHCEDDVLKLVDGIYVPSGKTLCGIYIIKHTAVKRFPLPLEWWAKITCEMCRRAIWSACDEGNP